MMSVTEWIIAVCAILGFLVTVVGVAFGYGAFRGRSEEARRNQKEATARSFADQKELRAEVQELRKELLHSRKRAKRGERIAVTIREHLQERGQMPRSETQVGADGRGVPNPLRPRTPVPPPAPRGALTPPPRKP